MRSKKKYEISREPWGTAVFENGQKEKRKYKLAVYLSPSRITG